mgnify:CR=1 FL=1
METKGNRLRSFAKARCGTLVAFASLLGVAPQQLQPYVSNKRFPQDDILEKMAAMGCNIHWLLTGEGAMYADNEAGRELYKKSPKAQEFDKNEKNPNPVVMIPQFQINAAAALPDTLREIETDIKQVLSKIQSILQ